MVTPQKFTQKYTIIQLFEDLEDGYEFSSDAWPLHSTLVDVFAIDWSVDEMVSHLNNLLSTHMTAPTYWKRFFRSTEANSGYLA
jgi:hypothetical protein